MDRLGRLATLRLGFIRDNPARNPGGWNDIRLIRALQIERARTKRLRAELEESRKLADDAIENVMMCVCTTAYTDHKYYTKWCNENHSSGDIRKAMGWV